jgi:hypothetical protein
MTQGPGLPASLTPQAATEGNLTTFSYPIPLSGPDLAPAVTLGNGRWMLGTSPSFTAAVAATPQPPRGASSVQSIGLNTASFAAFANAWANALEEDPGLSPYAAGLMPADPATLRAAAKVLQTPRRFVYEARWENNILHRRISLQPSP